MKECCYEFLEEFIIYSGCYMNTVKVPKYIIKLYWRYAGLGGIEIMHINWINTTEEA